MSLTLNPCRPLYRASVGPFWPLSLLTSQHHFPRTWTLMEQYDQCHCNFMLHFIFKLSNICSLQQIGNCVYTGLTSWTKHTQAFLKTVNSFIGYQQCFDHKVSRYMCSFDITILLHSVDFIVLETHTHWTYWYRYTYWTFLYQDTDIQQTFGNSLHLHLLTSWYQDTNIWDILVSRYIGTTD